MTQDRTETEFFCSWCGTSTKTAHQGNSPFCKACSAISDTWSEAEEQLERDLEPVIAAWRTHWQAAGLDAGIVCDIACTALEDLMDANQQPAGARSDDQ